MAKLIYYRRFQGGQATSHTVSRLATAAMAAALASGAGPALGQPVDTTVAAWGYNCCGQASIPDALTNAVAISAASGHSLALLADGRVVGWGSGEGVPVGLQDVVAVAAGSSFSVALRAAGTPVAWGSFFVNGGGLTPVFVPPDVTNATAIAAGSSHAVALRRDGTVSVWGTASSSLPPAGLTNVTAIAAGAAQNLALLQDGTVVTWVAPNYPFYPLPAGLTNVVSISAAYYNFAAMKSDGTTILWGNDDYGQVSQPPPLRGLRAIAAADFGYACIRDDWTVNSWGWNYFGRTNVPPLPALPMVISGSTHILVLLSNSAPVVRVSPQSVAAYTGQRVEFKVGAVGTQPLSYQWFRNGASLPNATAPVLALDPIALADAGTYAVTIANSRGQTTVSNFVLTVSSSPPLLLVSPTNRVGYLGRPAAFEATAAGSGPLSYQWRFNGLDIPGANGPRIERASVVASDFGDYSVVVQNSLGSVTSDPARLSLGPIVVWGDDSFGQTQVPSDLDGVQSIAAGLTHSLALRVDGTVVGWGDNDFLESTPPLGLTDVAALSAGNDSSVALRSNGTVVVWGNTMAVPEPLVDASAIACGPGYNVVVRSNGTVVAWGWPGFPAPAPSISNAIAVAAGPDHGLVLLTHGQVTGWGDNSYGQSTAPAAIAGRVIAVAAGEGTSYALLRDGRIAAWGWGADGQTNVPSGATNIVGLAAHGRHALAVRDDGRVWRWGQTSPAQAAIPPASEGSVSVAAGGDHDLTLRGSGPLRFLLEPASQDVRAGIAVSLAGRAVGTGSLSYQWLHNGQPLGGATGAYLNLTNPQGWDAGLYSLVASTAQGSITSRVATLTVIPVAPTIAQAPVGQVGLPGGTVTFTAGVTGSEPLTFQWLFQGEPLPGANGRSLTLSNLTLAQRGGYQLVVSNAAGSATSEVAELSIYALNEVSGAVTEIGAGPLAWGDFDRDGFLDLLTAGRNGGPPLVFHHEGGGFASTPTLRLTNINLSTERCVSALWADFDGDGWLDILLTRSFASEIWRNGRDGTFTNLNLPLGCSPNSAGAAADFDRDGRLDFIAGSVLQRNLGGSFANASAGLPEVIWFSEYAQPAWGDFDQDGWPDLAISGLAGVHRLLLLHNQGNGSFTNVEANLPQGRWGAIAWGDFNGDGRPDLFAAGDGGARSAAIFRNDGGGAFSMIPAAFPSGAAAWGDFDNDGNSDLLFSGISGPPNLALLAANTGLGGFNLLDTPIIADTAAWGDVDRDGRLDLAVGRSDPNSLPSIGIYRSSVLRPNTPPSPPTLRPATAAPGRIELSWNPGGDLETPEPALAYSVRIGTSPGAGDLVRPDADANGVRLMPGWGNAQTARKFVLTDVSFGTFYWSAQTVDGAFAGSEFAPAQRFVLAGWTLPATNVTTDRAQLVGQADPSRLGAVVWFEWGLTSDQLINATPAVSAAAGGAVQASLIGLQPGTRYFVQLKVTDPGGTYAGGIQSFVTVDRPGLDPLPASEITADGAILHVAVTPNRAATVVWFEYGTSSNYGLNTVVTNLPAGSASVVVHLPIVGLDGGTFHHFRAVATNEAGMTRGPDQTFATTPAPEGNTLPASDIGPTSVTFRGQAWANSLPTEVYFEYDRTPALTLATPAIEIGAGIRPVDVGIPVTGLLRRTTYYYRLVVRNSFATNYAAVRTVRTTNDVITLPPAGVGLTNATLRGLVLPEVHGAGYFFYHGLTEAYGSVAGPFFLGPGTNLVPVSFLLTSLVRGATYHYRVVATNASGLRFGDDVTFKTGLSAFDPAVAFVDGRVVLRGTGLARATYTVEASVDLVTWTVIGTTQASASGALEVSVPDLSPRAQFFRLRRP